MADYGAQDTSTTSLGANQFPISEAWTPNAGFSAVEGGTQTTDAGGKKSAPISVYAKDGNDLTQGAQADVAYTSGSGSIVSILKGIFTKIAGTLTISGAVTTSGTVTEANSAASKTDLDTIVTNTNKIPASPATEGGHLATIDSHIPALGQALAASSVPVVLTSAQQTALTPPAAITGFALEAGHLASIDTHIPAQGQALAAASVPVVLPVTQITTLTPPAAITGFALEAGHIATIDTHTPALGQATKAASSPVTLASDQGDLLVKGDFTEVAGQGTGVVTGIGTFLLPETDISAYKHFSMTLSGTWTMTLIVEVSNTSGANYQTLVVQQPNPSVANFSSITANGTYDAPLKWRFLRIRVSVFTSNVSLASTFEFYTLPGALEALNAAQAGTWTVQPGNTANTTPWLVSQSTSTTGTKTSVASSATSVTILASNASRKGAMIYNDSTQVLYLDLSGGTASNTSYSVQVQPSGFFELPAPAIYSGAITGIWAAANGNARVTEFS